MNNLLQERRKEVRHFSLSMILNCLEASIQAVINSSPTSVNCKFILDRRSSTETANFGGQARGAQRSRRKCLQKIFEAEEKEGRARDLAERIHRDAAGLNIQQQMNTLKILQAFGL